MARGICAACICYNIDVTFVDVSTNNGAFTGDNLGNVTVVTNTVETAFSVDAIGVGWTCCNFTFSVVSSFTFVDVNTLKAITSVADVAYTVVGAFSIDAARKRMTFTCKGLTVIVVSANAIDQDVPVDTVAEVTARIV